MMNQSTRDYLGHKIHIEEEEDYGWQWRVEFADEREDAYSNWFRTEGICLAAAKDFLDKGGEYDETWPHEE